MSTRSHSEAQLCKAQGRSTHLTCTNLSTPSVPQAPTLLQGTQTLRAESLKKGNKERPMLACEILLMVLKQKAGRHRQRAELRHLPAMAGGGGLPPLPHPNNSESQAGTHKVTVLVSPFLFCCSSFAPARARAQMCQRWHQASSMAGVGRAAGCNATSAQHQEPRAQALQNPAHPRCSPRSVTASSPPSAKVSFSGASL